MLRRALDAALAALGAAGPQRAMVEAVARLEPLGDPDPDELAALARALTSDRPQVQTWCIRRAGPHLATDQLLPLCQSRHAEVRAAAAEALLPRAEPALYEQIGWTAETLGLLAACDLETARPALTHALHSRTLQDAAATALLRFDGQQTPFLRRLANHPSALERLRACTILLDAQAAPPRMLQRLLKDDDQRVRLQALEVCAALKHWEPVVASLRDVWCRARACALAPEEMLVSVLTDPDRDLVEEALLALVDRGYPPDRDGLDALEHVVATEVDLLAAFSDRRGVDGLMAVAVEQAVDASQSRLRLALSLSGTLSAPAAALTSPPTLKPRPNGDMWTQLARHTEGPLGSLVTQLRSIDILEALPTRLLARLAAETREMAVERQVVVERDHYGSELFLILDGAFQAVAGTTVVRTMGPGEAFGELGALVPAPRSMTVRSCGPGRLLVLDGVHLAAALRRPDHVWPLVAALVRRIQTQSAALPPAPPPTTTQVPFEDTLVHRALALHGCSLFRETRPEVVARVAAACKRTRLKARQLLFSKGQPSDSLHIVVSGSLEITEGLGPLALLGPGAVVGELGALTGDVRSASARAVEAVTLLSLSREELQRQARHAPELGEGMVRVLVQRLRDRSR